MFSNFQEFLKIRKSVTLGQWPAGRLNAAEVESRWTKAARELRRLNASVRAGRFVDAYRWTVPQRHAATRPRQEGVQEHVGKAIAGSAARPARRTGSPDSSRG